MSTSGSGGLNAHTGGERLGFAIPLAGAVRARLVLDLPRGSAAAATASRIEGVLGLLSDVLESALSPESGDDTDGQREPPSAAPVGGYAYHGAAAAQIPASVLRCATALRGGTVSEREARIHTAYRFGRADGDAAVLARDGARFALSASPTLAKGHKHLVWVVLYHPERIPFWTTDPDLYHDCLRPGGIWHPQAVYRGFRSRSELDAYLAGSGILPHPLQRGADGPA